MNTVFYFFEYLLSLIPARGWNSGHEADAASAKPEAQTMTVRQLEKQLRERMGMSRRLAKIAAGSVNAAQR